MRIKLLLALLIPLYGISQTKISIDINGEAPGDLSGYSVSLSSDGNIVAIGAPYNTGNGIHSGHVRIYENASGTWRSEEHTSELQSRPHLVCRLLLEKKKKKK